MFVYITLDIIVESKLQESSQAIFDILKLVDVFNLLLKRKWHTPFRK